LATFVQSLEINLLNIQVGLKQQQSVAEFKAINIMNLATLKAAAKLELLYNKPVFG
jgi:hypothetical protein